MPLKTTVELVEAPVRGLRERDDRRSEIGESLVVVGLDPGRRQGRVVDGKLVEQSAEVWCCWSSTCATKKGLAFGVSRTDVVMEATCPPSTYSLIVALSKVPTMWCQFVSSAGEVAWANTEPLPTYMRTWFEGLSQSE